MTAPIKEKGKVVSVKRVAVLTEKQDLFLKYYLGEANLNASLAAKLAGYSEAMQVNAGRKILNATAVQLELDRRVKLRKDSFSVKEDQILRRLWEEANNNGENSTHAGRINALVWLGKHLGMFSEKINQKEADQTINYNIVNYQVADNKDEFDKKVKNKIDEFKNEVEKESHTPLPEGVLVTSYKH